MNILLSKKLMLSKEISENLKELVLSGQLNPGDKLPNEVELANKMEVSRSTLREAVKELVAANVLEVIRGKGTFVTKNPGWKKDPLGVEFMVDKDILLMLFETRILIEPNVAYLAAERADSTDLEKIGQCLGRIKDVVKQHQDYSRQDLEFHQAIAKATKNPIIQRIVPIINESIVQGYQETMNVPGSIDKAIVAHQHIYEAILAKDLLRAQAAMKQHLEVTVNDIKSWMLDIKGCKPLIEENKGGNCSE
ncbi:FadR/GntR family transcriptional regulator [Sporomusa sp.]|uniref:FadR/GntR family transcriptional regulator n=1 Tax=Sporomusa sp. TaxID=2078658 RepID=UPI002BAC1B33|nr:FadR/GntR family transcriptional regulator [Sporomusa sp.]HWR45913.1 FadR/GntR family transcriptional regulator [Sporomusa sp.]